MSCAAARQGGGAFVPCRLECVTPPEFRLLCWGPRDGRCLQSAARQVANAEYFMTTELDPSVRFDTTAANTPDVLAFLDQCVRACTMRPAASMHSHAHPHPTQRKVGHAHTGVYARARLRCARAPMRLRVRLGRCALAASSTPLCPQRRARRSVRQSGHRLCAAERCLFAALRFSLPSPLSSRRILIRSHCRPRACGNSRYLSHHWKGRRARGIS